MLRSNFPRVRVGPGGVELAQALGGPLDRVGLVVDAASGLSDALRIDPLRVFEAISGAAAVLAAGTVIASRGQVSGLTTGVTLWLTAAIGAGVGLGFYGLSILATLFAVATLALLAQVERRREE